MGTSRITPPFVSLSIGSSPRVWGQVSAAFCVAVNHGIIPTRMGTSIGGLPIGLVGRDHPHAYGDKNGDVVEKSETPGSSPRVWGQVHIRKIRFPVLWIIPTRMGTSSAIIAFLIFS